MERGFLSSDMKVKNNDKMKKYDGDAPVLKETLLEGFVKSGLAAKIKNIDGKIVGKDSNPRRPIHCVVDKAHVYVGGQPLKSILKKPKSTNHDQVSKVGNGADSSSPIGANVMNVANKETKESDVHVNVQPCDSSNDSTSSTSFVEVLKVAGKSGKEFTSSLESNAKVVNFRQLVNEEKVEKSHCVLPKNVAGEIKCMYDNTLKPPHCIECKSFGHGPSTCPKRAKEEAPKAPPMAVTRPSSMENQEDGFVEVTVRRNKGKKAANQHANNLIAGIRIHKPKSSFYKPINKHGTDKQPKKKSDDIRNASTSHTYGEKSTSISNADAGDGTKVTSLSRVKPCFTTPLSNPFDVLSAVEEDLCGPNDQNPKESEPVGNGSSNIDAEKGQEKDSIWSWFKEAKEASRSNPKTSTSDSD
nr:hypothetical protein [Tanacetum cinerariifolium]